MPIVYKIKNWDRVFETSESRKLKSLNWVALPNRWDGLGFSRVRKHKHAIDILAGWMIIVQIASKCPVRGLLIKDNIPLSAGDMGDLAGLPGSLFERALNVLSDPDQGISWIEKIKEEKDEPNLPNMGVSAGTSGESPDASGFAPRVPVLHNITVQDITKQDNTGIDGVQQRISEIFKRKPETKWSEKELKKLKEIKKRSDCIPELAELEDFYKSDYEYKRHDIEAFLNNWTGEIDKARNFKPKSDGRFAVGQKHFNEGQKLTWPAM